MIGEIKRGLSRMSQAADRRRVLAASVMGCLLAMNAVACSLTGVAGAAANKPAEQAAKPEANVTPRPAMPDNPFSGIWQACEGSPSPDQCSRYSLVQRDKRICGTWSYFASGDGYQGRVVAQLVSPAEARRTHACGRPGSEARTECDAGWDRIDKLLRLCEGRLGDLGSPKEGGCHAEFARVASADTELAALADEPWMQACLAGIGPRIAL